MRKSHRLATFFSNQDAASQNIDHQAQDVQDGHVWPIWQPWPFAQFFKIVTPLNQPVSMHLCDAVVWKGEVEIYIPIEGFFLASSFEEKQVVCATWTR